MSSSKCQLSSNGLAVAGCRSALQRVQAGDGAQAGLCCLSSLDHEVLGEIALVLGVLVKVVRREHRREHRHAGVQLHPHQAVDDSAGNEVMAVDAANANVGFEELAAQLRELGEGMELSIRIQREEIFDAMHRI